MRKKVKWFALNYKSINMHGEKRVEEIAVFSLLNQDIFTRKELRISRRKQ